MKRIIITIAVALCAASQAMAQSDDAVVKIYDPIIEKADENVTVTFRAAIDRKATRRNHSLVFAPVLTDGVYNWSLSAVVVQGRGVRVLEERHLLASGREVSLAGAVRTINGRIVEYRAEVPYQLWMEGAQLVMEGLNVGCCSASELAQQTMAEDLVLSPPVEVVPEPEPEPVVVVEVQPLSTGDKLAESYPFIRPASEYEDEIYDEDRDNAIVVGYSQGSIRINRDLGNNKQSLTDLMASIRIIENSADSRVKAVMIAGFASPEGSFDLNDRLAWNRAVAVKNYILEHSGLEPGMVKLYNGSEDWRGLRALVEQSDMPWKARVHHIIDTVPVWDSARQVGRSGELMRLDGGNPYRYMYRYWFPQLRNAAYIKVYYENK